jgi:hypothetical protein
MTQGNNKPTLLPFLAVLLCTMGALIMLLVLIARDVRDLDILPKNVTVKTQLPDQSLTSLPASESNTLIETNDTKKIISLAEAKETLDNLKLDAAEADWLTKQFSDSKNELGKQLANEEAYLASVEKQALQLRDEIKRLLELAKKIEQDNVNQNTVDVKSLEQLLKQKTDEQSAAEKRLSELRSELQGKSKSYAIVPYRGRGGTFRTPIYVECKDDKVIIQPEGIELTAHDFAAIDRADNPFDSLLRVARQYYAETGQIGRGEEPYPLIIIRPSGIHAFEAAYAAMGNWLKDYGYELVAEDWKMEYPQANDELRSRMQKQLTVSRQRLQGYVAAMKLKNGFSDLNNSKNTGTNEPHNQNEKNNKPIIVTNNTNNKQNKYNNGNGKHEYTVADGVVREINNSDKVENHWGKGLGINSDKIAQQNEVARKEINNSENKNNNNNNFRNEKNNNNFSDSNFANAKLNYPNPVSSVPNNPVAVNHIADNPFPDSPNPNSTTNNSQKNPLYETIKKLPPTNTTQNSTLQNSTTQNPTSQNSTLQNSITQNPTSQNPVQNSDQNLSTGMSRDSSSFDQVAGDVGGGRTFRSPVRRNIKIHVDADKFVVVRQAGFDIQRVVMIERPMQKSIENLVNVICDFMETWGIAGERFYWQPVLKIKILNGGDAHFKELQRQLKENEINILIEKE